MGLTGNVKAMKKAIAACRLGKDKGSPFGRTLPTNLLISSTAKTNASITIDINSSLRSRFLVTIKNIATAINAIAVAYTEALISLFDNIPIGELTANLAATN